MPKQQTALQQDGGRAAQAMMEESKQSVEEVKMVVAQARRKLGAIPNPLNHFNEDDFMDGMTPSPTGSPTKAESPTRPETLPKSAAKYGPPAHHCPPPLPKSPIYS